VTHLFPAKPAFLAAVLVVCAPTLAAPPPQFDQQIKPVFEQHCFKCHGPERQKGGLRLDVKTSALKGGDSGEPAVVPGSPLKSHLIKLVTSTDPDEAMPPKGERLKPEEVALLRNWIETGAHWPDSAQPVQVVEATAPERQITEQDRQFWSFVPPRSVEPPVTKLTGWARTRIDRFILSRLEQHGLTPSGDAPKSELIRRVTYDLTGLPPTPEEVEAFVQDNAQDAYDHLVDRLLASPRFGERLASMWLPLAHYAEDQAHQVGSDTKFFYPNAWRYRQWVIEAFNRDLPYDRFLQYQLAADKIDGATPDDQAALGFLGLGPKYYDRDRLAVKAEEWEDRVDTVSRTMLGLTVACARCHDHKFDPISQRDYYGLAGVFASTRLVNRLPDGTVQKGELEAPKVDPGAFHVITDGTPQDLNVFIRGNADRKGPVVPRRFLAILSNGEPTPFKDGSGRRELAMAITDRGNPLTARVMVNRVWGMLFGSYLVATPSNFGRSGQPPSYRELLDDLAVGLMEPPSSGSGHVGGWSIKSLVREMVCSSTYRQSSRLNPIGMTADPANDLLWHMNRRRMTIEQWRDGILFAAGRLDPSGGKSVELDEPANCRRTVYARISRLKLDDVLMQFDYPDANVHAEKRSVTNTPMQKLFVLNSPFVLSQAKAFAARVASDIPAEGGDEPRVRRAYQLLFARDPDRDELDLAAEFLSKPAAPGMTRWEEYAQVLLASNEALYVD
jgi:mono/diheme cytochrome c family protein